MYQAIKNNLAILLVAILSLAPLLFWSAMMPLEFRFAGFAPVMTSLGQISGLIGASLFSLNLILAARYKTLDKYLNGLNVIYKNHHLVGGLAFILLLIHPLFLAVRLLPVSVHAAALFLLPSTDNLPVLYGGVALDLMMILLILTFYFRPRYDIWKFTHRFLSLSFFIASLHIFFVPSDITNSPALKVYMFTLIALAFISAVYKEFISGLTARKTYLVKQVMAVNSQVTEIELEPAGRGAAYLSGQFIFVSFQDKNIGPESHPFSLTSGALDKTMTIAVKSLGDWTNKIKNLTAGTLAKIEGPFGKFNFRNFSNNSQIWIAGGIGITPFLGMMRSLRPADSGYNIDFYYSVVNREEAAFLDELVDISRRYSNLKLYPYFSAEQGRITAEKIKAISGDPADKEILVCGPPVMMKSLRQQFVALGVDNDQIHSEEFEL